MRRVTGCCHTVEVALSDGGRTKLNPTQVARAGEHYVTAEIHRRGGYAACFGGNMPDIDVLASNGDQTRAVTIQVKTKTAGTWQTRTTRGMSRDPEDSPVRFWVLVDLRTEPPGFYVIPEWWMQNDIFTAHQAYIGRHGGKRKTSTDSTHHAIQERRVQEWRDRWDLLGILGN